MVLHGPYPIGEPRVTREARVAVARGFEVDVVAMKNPGERGIEVVDGVRVLRLPFSHKRGSGFARVFGEYAGFTALATAVVSVLMVRRRYEVVQVHNPPDFLMLASLVPKMLGGRVLFDIHDLAPELFAMRFADRPWAKQAERMLRLVEKAATRVADAVITVHEPYRTELVKRGVPADKLVVVLNSVDEDLLPSAEVEPAHRGFEVVYHGTLTEHYGIELLIEAVAQLVSDIPDIHLSVYGDGDSLPAIRARIASLDLVDRVELVGRYLPQREVLGRVQGASVGVVSNLAIPRNELAVPTKLFEYVALDIPVVASNLLAIREYFSSDEIRLFRAGSVDDLAAALREIALDPRAAATRTVAAKRRYEAYRWSTQAARYAALLERDKPLMPS